MKMFCLDYFAKKDEKSRGEICGDDFKNKDKKIHINLELVVSFDDLILFELPFSQKPVDLYAKVTMINGDTYYIRKESYNKLFDELYNQ